MLPLEGAQLLVASRRRSSISFARSLDSNDPPSTLVLPHGILYYTVSEAKLAPRLHPDKYPGGAHVS